MRARSVARLRRVLCAAQPQREGCGTRGCAPQTVLALFSRCVLRCSTTQRARGKPCGDQPPTIASNSARCWSLWATPSNGVRPGAVGEDCLRAKPEFRSRPACRVAQGTRRSRARNAGVAFFLVTFSWRPKKKLHAVRAEYSASSIPHSPPAQERVGRAQLAS
mgnify:CR=1 FL=1